jgi:hypothetical protein
MAYFTYRHRIHLHICFLILFRGSYEHPCGYLWTELDGA